MSFREVIRARRECKLHRTDTHGLRPPLKDVPDAVAPVVQGFVGGEDEPRPGPGRAVPDVPCDRGHLLDSLVRAPSPVRTLSSGRRL